MKVNPKLKRFLFTCLLILGGYIACGLLYVLFDQIINGFVREWFERNYVYTEWIELEDLSAGGYYTKTIVWRKVKKMLFRTLIVTVVFLVLLIRLITILYASRQERKAIQAAGRMIEEYMRYDKEASDVFPPGFAELSLQIVEIKAAMQRNEQMLREEASRKNDLITYLAHDLKTPLTSVIGYLSLLEEAPEMPAQQKAKYVHITLDKALRLEKLINEFFEITRYNLQQIVLEKETVNLSFMLQQMTDEFYPILSAHGNTIRLILQPEQEDINVLADSEKLARVFNNILKNAIAYSYPDTEIRVGCKKAENSVSILFANRGKTIPRHKLDAIFEKFFRLDDARATNTGGAGLGLAIAREIVTLHQGTIIADSENEVTVFKVELPVQG